MSSDCVKLEASLQKILKDIEEGNMLSQLKIKGRITLKDWEGADETLQTTFNQLQNGDLLELNPFSEKQLLRMVKRTDRLYPLRRLLWSILGHPRFSHQSIVMDRTLAILLPQSLVVEGNLDPMDLLKNYLVPYQNQTTLNDRQIRELMRNAEICKFTVQRRGRYAVKVSVTTSLLISELQGLTGDEDRRQAYFFMTTYPNLKANSRESEMILLDAVRRNRYNIVNYLLKNGVNANTMNKERDSPLGIAAECGHLDIMKYLLEYGANINWVNREGDTPLMKATKNYKLDIVKYLSKRGANLQTINRQGQSSLSCALMMEDSLKMVKYFVEVLGMDVNAPESPALHHASFFGKKNYVEYLLKQGARLDGVNREGKTALMVACEAGHLKVVKYLVKKGANLDLVDHEGKSAMSFAAKCQHPGIVKFLVKSGFYLNDFDLDAVDDPFCSFKESSVYHYLEQEISRKRKPEHPRRNPSIKKHRKK